MRIKLNRPIRALVLLLLISYTSLSAQGNKTLSIKSSNSTLVEVFKQIEKQADVTIAYNVSQMPANSKVNVNVVDQSLENVLNEILKETALTYKVEGNYVVIVQDKKSVKDDTKRTGTVVDDLGETLPGVSVVIKGTTVGTTTDLDGNFTLATPDNATLVLSYIGFVPVEKAVGTATSFDFVLKEDVRRLDEVVVLGYNMVKLGQITGSIKNIDGKAIENQSSPTLENRLQGKIAGVMISGGSGQPGSDNLSIRIRGSGSINGSNTPLYIMDGVMVEPAQFAALNSNDIADIQILKDASSTAIYGSRGSNGVVVITTKTGVKGKTEVTYKNQFGLSVLPNYIDMMTGEQNIEYQLKAVESDPGRSDFPLMQTLLREKNGTATQTDLDRLALARNTNTDWIDEMSRNGFLMEHSLGISGGSDKTKFYVSGSFLEQDGVLNESSLKRYSGRFNLDHNINKYVDFGLKGTFGFSEIDFSDPSGTGSRNSWANPWFTALLAYPYEDPETWNNVDNPTMITKYYSQKKKNLKGIWATYFKANIFDWLFAKTNFGMDYMNNRGQNVLDRNHPNASGNKGSYTQDNSELTRYTWTNTVNFVKDFSNGHSISAVAGMEMFQGRYYSSGFTGYDVNEYMSNSPAGIGDKTGASSYPPSVKGSKTMSNLMSYFTQVGYAIDNKYNMSASLRHDTSSKFAKGNRSAVFWSVGGSWNLTGEDFLQNNPVVNYLRLRASYGTTGNQDGVNDYAAFNQFGNTSYNGNSGYVHNVIGNPTLKWETSGQANIGVDFTTWNNRLNMTVDVYHKKTQDLFMNKKISATSGFTNLTTNAGGVVNKGIEFSVDVDVVRLKDFKWNIGANLTYNKNELTDLGSWANAEGFLQNGDILYQKGKSLGTWRMYEWAGVNPDDGLVQFYDKDRNKTTNISEAEKFANFKSYEVPLFGGFNTNITYRDFSFMADFTFAADYYVMNGAKWYLNNHHFNGNKPVAMLDMWMKPGDITDVPRFGNNTQPSPWASQFLEDASYLRLKNIRVNYNLPRKLLDKTNFFTRVGVYAQVENVYTWTGYSGADPEVNGQLDMLSFPKPRNFILGFDISF